MKKLAILGTRGVPGAHGGFETFAEELALYLIERSWQVTVYCQSEGRGPGSEDEWRGIRRIVIPVRGRGATSTIVFDWRATLHAAGEDGIKLVLGYNTAIFNALLRLRRRTTITNMDGIEWRREKWGPLAKTWFFLNDWLGCLLSHHLVADHPEIQRHLETRVSADRITMIPYGGRSVLDPDPDPIAPWDLRPGSYALVIARPEPENSILQIVSAFSRRSRGARLVLLGAYDADNPYHRRVREAASAEVLFAGAIYDQAVVDSLRGNALVYVHGHTVGGTNPSLVEALGAGCPVIAHDNLFNRWVAGGGAAYFRDEDSLAAIFDDLLRDAGRLAEMSAGSRDRHAHRFTWRRILGEYEELLAGPSIGGAGTGSSP